MRVHMPHRAPKLLSHKTETGQAHIYSVALKDRQHRGKARLGADLWATARFDHELGRVAFVLSYPKPASLHRRDFDV